MNTDTQPPAKLGGRRGRKHGHSPLGAFEGSTQVKVHRPLPTGRSLFGAARVGVFDAQG